MSEQPTRPPVAIRDSTARLGGGPLNDEQRRSLEQFKQKLAATDHFRDATEDRKASHTDETLLRFLRARKWDLRGALRQFTDTEDWRRKNRADETYDHFPVEEFEMTRLCYPQWTGRRDKAGIPLYCFVINELDKDEIKHFSGNQEKLTPRMIALYEHMLDFVLPFTSSSPHTHPDIPINGTTSIVDVEGVSLSKFWALRDHLASASSLATAHYPDTLNAVFVIGCPSWFSKVWAWVKPYFDEGTREKIFILSREDQFETLTQFIDPANLPKKYGGELDWQFGRGSRPILDEDEQKVLGYESLPRGPLRWTDNKLVVLGTERSAEEKEKYAASIPEGHEDPTSQATPSNGDAEEHKASHAEEHTANRHANGAAVAANSSASRQNSVSSKTSTDDKRHRDHAGSTTSIKSAFAHMFHPTRSRSRDSSSSHDGPKDETEAKEGAEAPKEEPKHTIWDSARSHPSAPIRDLADQLDDVSLATNVASPAAPSGPASTTTATAAA